jgi:hypothetical protein
MARFKREMSSAKLKDKIRLKKLLLPAIKTKLAQLSRQLIPMVLCKFVQLGGAFPWIYGEGVVDIIGDRETISGILSFGSRHISHESPKSPAGKQSRHLGIRMDRDEIDSGRIRRLRGAASVVESWWENTENNPFD